jgi:phosphatidylglycerophosphatase A
MKTSPSFIAYIVTWFGAGYAPKASGTWGSLAALAPAYFLHLWGSIPLLIASWLVFLEGVWLSNRYMADIGELGDHKEIVIDEVAGIWLTLAFVPHTWHGYLCGFVLFRFFDILKPFPISWMDRRFKCGFGVMVDDMAAGLFAAATYLLAQFLLQ